MEVKDYLEILKTVKSVSMATTAKDGTPRSRIIDIMLIEDEKIYFLTARGKDFYADLMRTKRVALFDCESVIKIWHPTNRVTIKTNTINNQGAFILDLKSVPSVIIDNNNFWGGSMTVSCEEFTFTYNNWDSISSNMILKGIGNKPLYNRIISENRLKSKKRVQLLSQ